ncbi:MAG: uroporphyrinogen-III synthase [Myxococcota bacterium]|nr:uroporphyrinogen-III synthase [Myxococcota bacterium]
MNGINAVWTGSADGAGPLLEALKRAGAHVRRLPLIEVGPPSDPERLDVVLKRIDRYAWIVLTSRQSARALKGRARPAGRVAAVGPGTAAQARRQGWRVHLVPSTHDAQGLAQALAQSTPGVKVLFLKGDRARRTLPETLEKQGFAVDEVEAYTTRPVPPDRAKHIASRIKAAADLVIAGSPLGVQTLVDAIAPSRLADIKPGLNWMCLGRATQKALLMAGVDAVYPDKVTPDRFVRCAAAVLGRTASLSE